MGLIGLDWKTVHNNQSAVTSKNALENCYDVQLRAKKSSAAEDQKKQNEYNRSSYIRYRPQSTNSFASIVSSGMGEIQNSYASPKSVPLVRPNFHEQPQVARQECLLNEEKDVINRGVDNANKLLAWYNDRLKSLEKRSELLKKGMVLLNPAVQEQKFDYLRAHISELNRRITSLIKTSEYGFPTHTNLQMRAQMPPVNDNRSNYLQKQNKVLSQELIDKEKIIDQLLKGKSGMLDNKIEKPKSQTNGNICVRTARVRPVFQKIASQTVPNSPSVRMQGTLM